MLHPIYSKPEFCAFKKIVKGAVPKIWKNLTCKVQAKGMRDYQMNPKTSY